MFRLLKNRPGHYLVLLTVGSALFFPNLGAHSLWDVDESHNAECAREMMEAENWRVPTFNFALRTDKPVLQYWLMISAYSWFGVSEFAARFWSAVAGMGSILVTYEIGRRMFCSSTGLLAGMVLASSIMFCVSSHAATPDALLIFCAIVTFWLFWKDYARGGRSWLIWIGLSTGLAVLAKGPVGWLLPATVIGLFLIWERRLRLLWDYRLAGGALLFVLIALPWYLIVGIETEGELLKGFFFKHNLGRYLSPMERHGGPIVYHPIALLAGFAPWSAFLGLACWFGLGRRARDDLGDQGSGIGDYESRSSLIPDPKSLIPNARGYRFLWCWIAVWLVFFSLAGTKLPNYILPAYPAFALLTARFLVRWYTGAIQVSRFWLGVSLGCLALVGVIIGVGLGVASGSINVPTLQGKELPALAPWALAGLIPIAAAVWAWRCLGQERRGQCLATLVAACVVLVSLLAAFAPPAVDAYKLPRLFADELAQSQTEREVQIGCYRYYQPGFVFYAQRQVERLDSAEKAVDLLHSPLQAFLVLPAEQWEAISSQLETPCRVVSRRRDFLTGREILLITNRS